MLAATTLIAFRQVGDNGFISLDDNVYITNNYHIRNGLTIQGLRWAVTTCYAGNWHPLTWASHMLDTQFAGLKPQQHHFTNLLFHVINALLLFFVLHRMTGALPQSAVVAALFALHPLHVESVAWVAERKDVLSTFFFMLALLAYGYYAGRPRLRSYLAVIVPFALGLTAKPMLVTLPFVLLLLDYWPLGRFARNETTHSVQPRASSRMPARGNKGKAGKRAPNVTVERYKPVSHGLRWAQALPLVLEKIPFFALTILSCAGTYIAQRRGGAFAPVEIYSPGIRITNAIVSYFIYISKTFWPDNLAVFYPHPGLRPLWQVMGASLLLVAVTYSVFRFRRKFPYLPVGWLWFTGTLVPVIGVIQVGGQAMADRYSYIPSIGLFIMTVWGLTEIFAKRRYGQVVLATSTAVCLTCLFLLTRTPVGYWRDSITLFDHTLSVTENNFQIYNNRGGVYLALGNYARAIEDFDRAILINPHSAPIFNNRGSARYFLGNQTQAAEDFDMAVAIDPRCAEAYTNRGIVQTNMENLLQAVQNFDRAIEINPEYAGAFYYRGRVHGLLGNQEKSMEDLKTAARFGSDDAGKFLRNLGMDR